MANKTNGKANRFLALTREHLAVDLDSCDFCDAEAQLLQENSLANEEAAPPVPFALFVLAKSLLPKPASTVQQRAARGEYLSLIQA